MMKLYTNGDWRKTKLYDENGNEIKLITKIFIFKDKTTHLIEIGLDRKYNIPIPYNNICKLTIIRYIVDIDGYPIIDEKTNQLKKYEKDFNNVLICRWEELLNENYI